MARLRNYIAYLVAAIAAAALTHLIRSTVIVEVVVPALPTIVLALLAINVQTTAVIAVKLRELAGTQKGLFSRSMAEVRFALVEQGVLVLVAFALNAVVKVPTPLMSSHVVAVVSYLVLFASLHIFVDTTIGLLTVLFPE
jgi:hypothetical protein